MSAERVSEDFMDAYVNACVLLGLKPCSKRDSAAPAGTKLIVRPITSKYVMTETMRLAFAEAMEVAEQADKDTPRTRQFPGGLPHRLDEAARIAVEGEDVAG